MIPKAAAQLALAGQAACAAGTKGKPLEINIIMIARSQYSGFQRTGPLTGSHSSWNTGAEPFIFSALDMDVLKGGWY